MAKLALLFLMTMPLSVLAQTGQIVFEGEIDSQILQSKRTIRIYLPPGYRENRTRKFPVLYLHDGQNVFSTAGPGAAFGWGGWELDKTVDELVAKKEMAPIIMVAIDNTRNRYREYRGNIHSSTNLDVHFERYARFLIEELKPKIDGDYRTLKRASNTGVMGSSMGGLCSLALAWEHPQVFGLAASLSGAFQVEQEYFRKKILAPYRGKPKKIRLYVDSGVVDFTGDDDGRAETEGVVRELLRIGWKPGVNLMHHLETRTLTETEALKHGFFGNKIKEAQTSQHNEFYWRKRAWRALAFLFPP